MAWSRIQYWTMFLYGGNWTLCSKHVSFPAANRAAARCEKRGGAKHVIVKVDWLT